MRSRETELYAPVKAFLAARGFEAKGEVRGCDLVALSAPDADERVVVVELKLGLSLELVLQAVDRLAAADEVWLAVPHSGRRDSRGRDPRAKKLCKLLGVGLLGVHPSGAVELLVEPTAYKPRRDPKERSRLVLEHRRRQGDPTPGGSTRQPIMTAYRQQALRCAQALAGGLSRPRDVAPVCPDAAKILAGNVYGWFERVARGHYGLTALGREALERWAVDGP